MVCHWSECPSYRSATASLKLALQALQHERSRLKLIPRQQRSDKQQRRFTNLPSLIRTKEKRLFRWESLNLPSWDLLRLIQECEGTVWSQYEELLWHKELASHEGRGEASLRHYYCLPDAEPSQRNIDIPELAIEAKNVQGRRKGGKFGLQSVQAGSAGRQAYSTWMGNSAEAGIFKDLPDEVRMALFTGEVSTSIMYGRLPVSVRDALLIALRPTMVFREAGSIDCTTRYGFLHVPARDFADAWHVDCVTKCGPKYTLKRTYLLSRLRSLGLAAQDQANVAA